TEGDENRRQSVVDAIWKDAIWKQEKFLRSLRGSVGCAGFYHKNFPAIFDMWRTMGPSIQILTAIEIDMEKLSKSPPSSFADDLRYRLNSLEQEAEAVFDRFVHDKEIPSPLLSEVADTDAPRPTDCAKPKLEWPIPRDQEFTLPFQPPYLAM